LYDVCSTSGDAKRKLKSAKGGD